MRTTLLTLGLILIGVINPQAQSTATITGTNCPGNGCVTYQIAGQGSIGINISGTWSGTITFQGSVGPSSSSTFDSILGFPSNSTTGVTTTTGNGTWFFTIAGLSQVRVIFTSYTSGTASVIQRSTTAARKGNGGNGGSGGSGTVTSVALSAPTDVFNVTGSPITDNGTLAMTFDSQSANRIFAGPTTGSAAAPTFRALVAADVAGLTGSGTVTSIGVTLPTDVFDVSGSPVTTSGTVAATFDTQAANRVFAGPTTGSAAAPTFRALVAEDISGLVGSGTVTSVGLTAPTDVFNISGSPITSNGDIALTFDTQSANLIFAGPTTGGAATPAFRSLVAADVAGLTAPTTATYITQTANGSLSNEQALGSLATGIMKSTTTTGVVSIADETDIISLWSGMCDATTILGGDGMCSELSTDFDVITSGTNTVAAMIIGTGASLTTTGDGTNAANYISNLGTAAPSSGDCDDAAETGKLFWDSNNDNLYVCSGASGWRKIATAAP